MSVERRTDRLLVVLVLVALSAWLIRAHWEGIDEPHMAEKLQLQDDVLANEAPDPYEYKLWPISHALEAVHRWTGIDRAFVIYGNTALSVILLVFLHQAWLRTYARPAIALVGSLTLGALGPILLLNYWHHPYDLWGVALYCLLLLGMARDWRLGALVPLALVTGLVWEKHAVLPLLWGLWSLQRGRPFLRTLGGGLLLLAASLAVPVAVRLLLGGDRDHVDGNTTWAAQSGRVLWTQIPYVLPFVAILLLRWQSVPTWVRWLWLAVPLAFAAYASQGFILHETRSFWLLVPVFTATLTAWLAALGSASAGVPPATQVPVPRG